MDKSSLRPAHLRRIKSLAQLNDSQLTRFLNYVEVVVYEHSGSIFRQGQSADSMFLILEGEVRVHIKQKSGELLYLRLLHAGDAFGEIALLTQSVRSASVEAVKESLLLKISADSFHKLLADEPELAVKFLYRLACTLGRQLADVTTRLRALREFPDFITFIH
jgi:CRP-like cAMP-binding protein